MKRRKGSFKIVLSALLALTMVLGSLMVTSAADYTVSLKQETRIRIGATESLQLTVTEGYIIKNLKWSTDDANFATVTSNMPGRATVRGVALGATTIRAKYDVYKKVGHGELDFVESAESTCLVTVVYKINHFDVWSTGKIWEIKYGQGSGYDARLEDVVIEHNGEAMRIKEFGKEFRGYKNPNPEETNETQFDVLPTDVFSVRAKIIATIGDEERVFDYFREFTGVDFSKLNKDCPNRSGFDHNSIFYNFITINFYDEDGSTHLYTRTVEYGHPLLDIPEDPKKEDVLRDGKRYYYNFLKWLPMDVHTTVCYSMMIQPGEISGSIFDDSFWGPKDFKASYEEKDYLVVNFYVRAADGTTSLEDTQYLKAGDDASDPKVALEEANGYTLGPWDKSLLNILEDTDITARVAVVEGAKEEKPGPTVREAVVLGETAVRTGDYQPIVSMSMLLLGAGIVVVFISKKKKYNV